jgi:hypothetical protein
VKLFLSALLLAAASAAFAQNPAPAQSVVLIQPGQDLTPQQKDAFEKASGMTRAQMNAMVGRMNQTGCPLYMESASVDSRAGYLPVTARDAQNGVLNLRFRNQSGKAMASVGVTARVNLKTNIYALDAHTVELRLNFAGTRNLDREEPQGIQIGLPPHAYLFGVARVTLDQVTYADGSVWSAPASNNTCRTAGGSLAGIAQ